MNRIIIVEDQAMLRESLVTAIDMQSDLAVVGTLANADEAAAAVERLHPDLVLMDVYTERGASGIAATREIKRRNPNVRVVLMTAMPELTFIDQGREARADSFIYKNVGTQELLAVLRSTMDGYSTYPTLPPFDWLGATGLTEDEIAILRLACQAKSRQEIAAELFLSEGTVKRRISELLAKTGYDSILKLAVDAVSGGYIVPGIDHR